jgi:hypothetical protein
MQEFRASQGLGDVLQQSCKLFIDWVWAVGDLEEKRKNCQSIGMFDCRSFIPVDFLIHHHVQFHGKAFAAEQVFRAQRVVVAPVEMKLGEFINTIQWATLQLQRMFTFKCDLNCEDMRRNIFKNLL